MSAMDEFGGETMERRKKRKWPKYLFWAVIVIVVLSFFSKSKQAGRGVLGNGDPEIGQIDLKMPIFSSEPILDCFQQAEQSEKLKVLILRIDSPGGFVGSSQELYRRIKQFRARKNIPVIASVENVCASGAFYIAAAADTIIVNPGSQIGSIGVIVDLLNVRDLMDKFGVDARTFKTGKYKDAGDPTKRLTHEESELERKYFQGIIDSVLDQFVTDVAESRKLSVPSVRQIAHGGVFTGLHAVELGLVDSVGNYVDALTLAAAIAGVDAQRASATFFEPPDRRGMIERALFGKSEISPLQFLRRQLLISFMP